MYTPSRLNPRSFPAVVSATVAESEAITVLRPQPLAVDFAFGGGSGVGFAIADVGNRTAPANPAPSVAMPPTNERLPLEKGVAWFFGSFWS